MTVRTMAPLLLSVILYGLPSHATTPKEALSLRMEGLLNGQPSEYLKFFEGIPRDACCLTCNSTKLVPCRKHSAGGEVDPFSPTRTGDIKPASWPWIGNGSNVGSGDSKEKIYLFVLSDGHSGSSSLAGLISTSKHVTNLCKAEVWQCEGEKVLMHFNPRGRRVAQKNAFLNVEDRNAMKRGDETWLDENNNTRVMPEIDWTKAIKMWQSFWDQSKTIMMDKSPAFLSQGRKIAKHLRDEKMRTAFIVMSHSACTTTTKPHGIELRGKDKNPVYQQALPNSNIFNWNRTNMQIVSTLEQLKEAGENVIHVRYEAMLQDPARFTKMLEKFLPQLGTLDIHSSGIGNAWKYGGKLQNKNGGKDRSLSIAEYSKDHQDLDTCSQYPIEWQSEMRLLGYDWA